MAKMGITATFVSPDATEEELNAVADVIKREGRVSLRKLTKLCGSIIRMNGSEWCVC